MNNAVSRILLKHDERLVATRSLPARPAVFVEPPAKLHPELQKWMQQQGYSKLYSHQAEMFEKAYAGKSVVITTGTASGKSLSFYLPVVQRILENPSRRVLFIYPTKALTKDQFRNIREFVAFFGENRIQAGIYDGDTSPNERSRIREQANIILTNPDMLNASFLPNHNKYGFPHLFANLDTIVIDELHAYRGAFGSHVSNVFRRLLRICDYHGNRPRFLCSSATIANPLELAENICHTPFDLVERDGSPAPAKHIHFFQPEYLEKAKRKKAVTEELRGILPELILSGVRSITFCQSRRETEIVTKETRDVLASDPMEYGIDMSDKISAYRGGYSPAERAKIEQDLVDGALLGVVSTNALELGIDIGSLDAVVMGGFPGTRASFWQQLGRAGRNGSEAHAIVMLKEKPLDHYVGNHPDWLLNTDSENAIIDRDNLYIQLSHIRAASAELPLTIDDIASFPDLGEIIPLLQKEGELVEQNNSYQWSGDLSPAHEISLRNLTGDTIKVVDTEKHETITVVDLIQAKKEFYPGAIYLHDSVQYKSLQLDLESKTALVKEVNSNYYTEPHKPGNIAILMEHENAKEHRINRFFGDVRVSVNVTGFKMVEFSTHQNLGYTELSEILKTQMETEACWIEIPDIVVRTFVATGKAPALEPNTPDGKIPRYDYSEGLVHCLKAAASMLVMATDSDLGGDIFSFVDVESKRTKYAVVLYDGYPGGLGFSEKVYDFIGQIIQNAGTLVKECSCKRGCPVCVGDARIDKSLILWALRNFYKELPSPLSGVVGEQVNRPKESALPKLKWNEVKTNWEELLQRFEKEDRFGSKFLKEVLRVEQTAELLALYLPSGILKIANNDTVIKGLKAELGHLLETPEVFTLSLRAGDETDHRKELKIRRMMGGKDGEEKT
ncbi:DEAD/DEAH box helicase domain-containing protein [Mangrovibacterium marinum]|uniref:DEAD/DEAH box helicase domain-containing protein n=1 Tax=Mangrovibacterium marinum TaxID=1639118 RepID=A0A2T5C4E1_9BACT|nr:DEAD/DEAH box helicase [Mangrovibacterium marinum]PTN09745.1 DEAD/DEAH box helicase domain-containing protein [Mangrovibacterium marinum]